MAKLFPAPFADLVARLYLEPARQGSIFEFPMPEWWERPEGAPDLSATHHGRRAGNPLGPSSGPHTQMAQNIVLCYLGGARILELRTVQEHGSSDVPRPSVEVGPLGYHIEHSQELDVEDTLREYVAGMMMIEMLRLAPAEGLPDMRGPHGDVLFDVGLGYTLHSLQSERVQRFLDGMRNPRTQIEQLTEEIPLDFRAARSIEYPQRLCESAILSLGPSVDAEEASRMVEWCFDERELDVTIKLSPTSLGREETEHLLYDMLGYRHIEIPGHAYDNALPFEEVVELARAMEEKATAKGRSFALKFTDSLTVQVRKSVLAKGTKEACLSGPPLHVLALAFASRVRDKVGPNLETSFSAAVTADNFPGVVACGFVPVTSCTDLLRNGGYSRLPQYLNKLIGKMQEQDAIDIPEFILRACNKADSGLYFADEDERLAVLWTALLNTESTARAAERDPAYRAENLAEEANGDDITEDEMLRREVAACPNAANFVLNLPSEEIHFRDFIVSQTGAARATEFQTFQVPAKARLANFGEFCNECGNCCSYRAEHDGPVINNPSFYRSVKNVLAEEPREGFVVDTSMTKPRIRGRIGGRWYDLLYKRDEEHYIYRIDMLAAVIDANTFEIKELTRSGNINVPLTMDIGRFHMLRMLLESILDVSRLNPVNVRMQRPKSSADIERISQDEALLPPEWRGGDDGEGKIEKIEL